MRLLFPFFLLHASLFVLQAATVPQKTAADYCFSRPNLPSNIVGRVMGEEPAYSVMRSEDIAWLREAYAERAALAGLYYTTNLLPTSVSLKATFGKWPLAATNRFVKWTTATEPKNGGGATTNVIVGYNWTTNRGTGVDTARIGPVTLWDGDLSNAGGSEYGYLTTDNGAYERADQAWEWKTFDGARGPDWAPRAVTNVGERTVWFDAWTNCTSLIRMKMTNGTENVYTNLWRAYAPTSRVEKVTNVVWRHASAVAHMFTNGVVHGYGREMPGRLNGAHDAAAITNHYAFLRGLTRLAKYPTTSNGTLVVRWHGTDRANDGTEDGTWNESWDATNGVASLPFVRYSAGQSDGRRYTWNEGESFEDEGTREEETWSASSTSRRTTGGKQRYYIDPGLAMATGGGLATRSRTLFAEAKVAFHESYGASGKDVARSSGTNRTWTVFMPVGSVDLATDGTNVWFDAVLENLPGQAVGATGAPPIPGGDSLPDHKYGLPPAWHATEKEDPYHRNKIDAVRTANQRWEAEVTRLVLLIDFKPKASLPGWF